MSNINEVAPPGWGHTKAEKEKTKPWKPKSKIGGTIAAMKRAQNRGDIPKELNIFALAYSMKKKGAKPHYKPGTDEKYKKYQKEGLDFKTFYKTAKKAVSKRQDERKPEKAMDAGARAKRRLARRDHQSKVSTFVPDELKD